MIELPYVYAKLNDEDFPLVIGCIKFKTKQELNERYESDINDLAKLLLDVWKKKKLSLFIYKQFSSSLNCLGLNYLLSYNQIYNEHIQ